MKLKFALVKVGPTSQCSSSCFLCSAAIALVRDRAGLTSQRAAASAGAEPHRLAALWSSVVSRQFLSSSPLRSAPKTPSSLSRTLRLSEPSSWAASSQPLSWAAPPLQSAAEVDRRPPPLAARSSCRAVPAPRQAAPPSMPDTSLVQAIESHRLLGGPPLRPDGSPSPGEKIDFSRAKMTFHCL